MTVAQLISIVQNTMPNDISESILLSWINIVEEIVYTEYAKDKEKPIPKKIENIGQDNLSIVEDFGAKFEPLYEYYLYANICIYREEYGKANNYFLLYNSMIDEFVQYYFPIMSNPVRDKRLKNWR